MSDRPVVVIGGGPAGSAAAYWLARDGHQVILAEKKEHPRDKTCGDGLTPRAIYWLEQMGFDFEVGRVPSDNGPSVLRRRGALHRDALAGPFQIPQLGRRDPAP